MAKKSGDKAKVFVKGADLDKKFDELLTSGDLDERVKKKASRRENSHHVFFDTHFARMKVLIERGLSYGQIADLLREKIDSVRFEKLNSSTVRSWVISRADLKDVIDAQVAAGIRVVRPGSGRRSKGSGESVVLQAPVAPVLVSEAPMVAADVSVKPVERPMHLDGLRVKVFKDPTNAVMAMEDYASPVPGRPPLIVSGQMIYVQPTEKFSQMEVYKNFGLTEWSKEGGLLDRAVSYWRDLVWDPRRKAQLLEGASGEAVHAITVRAYIQDKDRLAKAAQNFKQFADPTS